MSDPGAYLDKARQSLNEAQAVAVIGFYAAAGRAAYAYNLKTAADYAVGVDVAVSASEATDAIDGAARFVGAN